MADVLETTAGDLPLQEVQLQVDGRTPRAVGVFELLLR
jgi:hypothetical protein